MLSLYTVYENKSTHIHNVKESHCTMQAESHTVDGSMNPGNKANWGNDFNCD